MPMQWTPAMATGDATIDDQHRQLIAWLNSLLSAMSQGKGREEIETVLRSLGDYTVMHFGHEEACMIRYKCPVAAENAAAHREFIRVFTAFKEDYERRGATTDLVLRVKEELSGWVASHIKRVDTNLGPCLGNQPR